MQNSSKKRRAGCTKSVRKRTSTKFIPDISFSRSPLPVISHATTAPGNESINTWTSTSSSPLLTRQHIMDLVASVSTSSANLYCILDSGKPSLTSSRKISIILSSLRQTGHYLNDILANLLAQELIKSSGAGVPKPSSRKPRRRS